MQRANEVIAVQKNVREERRTDKLKERIDRERVRVERGSERNEAEL